MHQMNLLNSVYSIFSSVYLQVYSCLIFSFWKIPQFCVCFRCPFWKPSILLLLFFVFLHDYKCLMFDSIFVASIYTFKSVYQFFATIYIFLRPGDFPPPPPLQTVTNYMLLYSMLPFKKIARMRGSVKDISPQSRCGQNSIDPFSLKNLSLSLSLSLFK